MQARASEECVRRGEGKAAVRTAPAGVTTEGREGHAQCDHRQRARACFAQGKEAGRTEGVRVGGGGRMWMG